MSPERLEAIMNKIDSVIGPPEAETPLDRSKRAAMMERDARARQIRKGER